MRVADHLAATGLARPSASAACPRLGARFKAGALLYTGGSTVPFGDRLAAVPLAGLWSV